MAGDAVLAEIDLVQILAGGDDGEQHVHVLEVEKVVDHLAPDLGQRFGLRAGAVPDRDVVARLEQAFGHGVAHAAHADPADPGLVLCHCDFSLFPHGSNAAVSSTYPVGLDAQVPRTRCAPSPLSGGVGGGVVVIALSMCSGTPL